MSSEIQNKLIHLQSKVFLACLILFVLGQESITRLNSVIIFPDRFINQN